MRRGSGGSRSLSWGVALFATWACGGTLRPPLEQGVIESMCALTEAPSTTGDTARIAFGVVGVTREGCALTLVAETLRPWPSTPPEPWTVQLALTPTGATARRLGSEDARNAIDAGAGLMATDDFELAAYAAARADLDVTPLPWDRTYMYLPAAVGFSLAATVARDAVRVDARTAESLACDSIPGEDPPGAGSGRTGRIVYTAGDRTARELAERVVALAEGRNVTAVGVSVGEFDAMLGAGHDFGYILGVPRSSHCEALAAVVQRAPWITSHSIVPLIDTRAHAIAPRAPRP
jgi:hypothetical protein